MGQEILTSRFEPEDYAAFTERLRAETRLLDEWLRDGLLDGSEAEAGFELEAWLIASDMQPAPVIEGVLAHLGDDLLVPELATFNAEINGTPLPLRGNALSRLAAELSATWARCGRAAEAAGAQLGMFGILPTVGPQHLTVAHMTPRRRYRALNEQILALRRGQPITLDIQGRERLQATQQDVMLESAATSFQIHLRIGAAEAARVYNASKILSAPMVAIAANSPFLFGRDLWSETRIPLFEQAVSVGGSILSERVSFGVRYAKRSILECFQANLDRYPVLLPQVSDDPPEELAHLRLHNGTIWRWNRPLIGLGADGRPHLRMEHRVVPSGPTVPDCIANAALYYGAVRDLIDEAAPPEARLPFLVARANFYTAAREGLAGEIQWLDGRIRPVSAVIADDLLPRARRGLARLGLEAAEIDHWLGIVAARLPRGRTGAAWQRAWVARHGPDMPGLTTAYLERQQSGLPVHEWAL
jgi:hypothetical protein